MPKSRFTIAFLLSFLATAALLQGVQLPTYPREVWIALAFFAVLALLLEASLRTFQYTGVSKYNGFGVFLLCVTVGAALAFVRVAQTTHVTTASSVEAFAMGGCREADCPAVSLHGFIVDEPDRRPMKTKYTVMVDELQRASSPCFVLRLRASTRPALSAERAGLTQHSAQHDTISSGLAQHGACAEPRRSAQHDTLNVSGKILVTDYAPWPVHDYGDEVRVTGVLERPGQIEEFHYDRYLSRYGIYSVMYSGMVETVGSGHGRPFFTFLYGLKGRFESQINRLYPEPHASFMAGLLTGSRGGIPERLLEDFRATGLTHIIAISGYNISIVMGFVSGLLFFLPLRWRFLPSLAAIVFFTFFVGASPSVVRAAIMGGLGLFALQMGRQKHSLIALLLAASVMTAWNPKMLWYDAGFQLSFLAVLGLALLSPILEPLFKRLPPYVGEPLQMTIAAQIFAVPLIAVLFGNFSVVAPLANVLVSLLVPLGMFFGFLGTAVSFVSYPLGLLLAYPGWGMLELVMIIAETLSEVPYATIAVPDVGGWVPGLYYLVLLGIVFLSSPQYTSLR